MSYDKVKFENVDDFAEMADYAVKLAKDHGMHFLVFAVEKDFHLHQSPGYLNFGMNPALLAEMVKVILKDMPPAGVAVFFQVFSDPRYFHKDAGRKPGQ